MTALQRAQEHPLPSPARTNLLLTHIAETLDRIETALKAKAAKTATGPAKPRTRTNPKAVPDDTPKEPRK
ncbi:hypothetical protein SEA_GARDENSTATE_59 [Microbacterium phage GardenState]|uniref:Uncharacterized protein n=2 Tax=Gardenstatevirus TaxID=3425012 RepID=A0A4Y6E7V3_9CAUD|nr:hypothetical protein SEA_IAMGROOT_58 [Microbacterium phage IAmGroot]QOI66971.1 hypothetical protein SEA_GARDENSTATE_59 [Microbacterium phage GardenState]